MPMLPLNNVPAFKSGGTIGSDISGVLGKTKGNSLLGDFLGINAKEEKEDEEEKNSSGILGINFGYGNDTDTKNQAQTVDTSSSDNSGLPDYKDTTLSDITDPKTYTSGLTEPGGILDTAFSFIVPGYSLLRNLKAMEDPDKYGKGTLYGIARGYGNKQGVIPTIGNFFNLGFSSPVQSPTVLANSPYNQGNPLSDSYAGSSSSSGAPGSYDSGFGSYGGYGSEADATQGAYDEASYDGVW